VRTLARARASFTDASGESRQELRAEGSVRYTRDETLVKREANLKVQTEYAANAVAEAKSQAIALADAGRADEAARVLRENSAQLGSIASSYANAPMPPWPRRRRRTRGGRGQGHRQLAAQEDERRGLPDAQPAVE
jgi:hypothetical protein